MKRFLLPLISLITIACSPQNAEENEQALDFTFELDTLMVDPGDEIIYLGYGLHTADLSKDGKYLYNFSKDQHLVEVIDLDGLVLKEKIPFEKEGPNGTGSDVAYFRTSGKDQFLVADFMGKVGFFTSKAEKSDQLALRAGGTIAEAMEEDEYITTSGVMDQKGETYYAIYQSGFTKQRGIVSIDLASKKVKKIPIPKLEELENFSAIFQQNGMSSARHASVYLLEREGKFLISNSAMNNLLVYDVSLDSVFQHEFSSKLTPNSQNVMKSKEVGSNEELNQIGKERRREVGFGTWIYDEKTDRYFRFTRAFVKEGIEKDEFKLVLTVLDKDFRQIYEGEDLPINKTSKSFFKDGKLYLFENINDELGFVVMTIKEN